MIDSSSIENLKSVIDIVDIVGNYIPLKKSGSNYKANCPFHNEKTPSFVVSPQKQIFHCFGCGAGGDVVKFVMEIEKLSYKEAIEKLASLYNIPLKYSNRDSSIFQEKRLLELVEGWYIENLKSSENVIKYLKDRGLRDRSIKRFSLGYSKSSKELISLLNSHQIPLPLAVEAGILAKGDNGELYARLADRVIFPIYSSTGSIIGFGGRALSGNQRAKYINSPQTKLFDKSKVLYGYNLARRDIFDKREIIITEGYLDVIMLHQAGFSNSVATLGTALTASHLPLVKKGEPKVILAYDGDSAGVKAAIKAGKLLASNGFEGEVVIFPEGLDPADMVAKGEIEKLKELFSSGKELIIFVIEQIKESFNLDNPHQKQSAIDEIKEFISTLSPVLQEAYAIEASRILGLDSAYFKSSVSKEFDALSQDVKIEILSSRDLAWESILKTLIHNKDLIRDVMRYINIEMAKGYEGAFNALLSGRDNPILRGIELDETIPILTEEELKEQLLKELQVFFIKKLKELPKAKNLDFRKKSYLIRKIKVDILPRLKQGELVEYESDFFI